MEATMVTNHHRTADPSTPKAKKGYKGMAMEGIIARWYATMTRKDNTRFQATAQQIVNVAKTGSTILEVAPGPGYLAIEVARLGRYWITGLDISKTFVDIAQHNARQAGVAIDFQLGDAAYMPFVAESFDCIVCTAAFKNFSQPVRALADMYRVLKPGGWAMIADLRRDASQDDINKAVDQMGLNRLNTALTKLIFRFMLLGRAYTTSEISGFVAQTAFTQCHIKEELIGMEIWLGK
jgi:ubiquinone/menaquinone biosynthesis C-methylase UbiE